MKIDEQSTTWRTLRTVRHLAESPELEPAAEAWFRRMYPSYPGVSGRAGTVLRGTRWPFRLAFLAVALRGHASLTVIGQLCGGVAHQHVKALYARLDTAHGA